MNNGKIAKFTELFENMMFFAQNARKKGTRISCTPLSIKASYGLYLLFSAHRSRITYLNVSMISEMELAVKTSDSFTAAFNL